MISCGIVVPVSGTSIIRRRAASTALRTASLTSFALPVATPTCPCPSPTATSALKPNRRPPFTTLATRLIAMTFSISPSPSRWRSAESRRSAAALRDALPPPRAASPELPSSPVRTEPPALPDRPALTDRARVRSPLELQSAFASAVGHGLHAPVILVARAVEHHLGDPLRLRPGGDEPPQRKALRGLALALDRNSLGRVGGAHQRHAARVVHDLGVHVLRGAEHDQAWPLGAASHLAAYSQVAPIAAARLGSNLMDRSHGLFRRLGGLAGLAPDLHAERLRLRLVPHPLNLERLREPFGHAVHHVGHQRAGEPVEGLVAALVGGSPHHDGVLLERDREIGMGHAADLAFRALHRDAAPVDLGGDALGQQDRLLADARHGLRSYQTTASSSPPTRAVRASRSVMSPCGVDRIAMPRPFLTRGISRALT